MRWNYVTLGLFVVFATSAPSRAQEFYKGKTIRVVVGGSAGGGFDIYTRAMARHMGKHIPGNPALLVENMTGPGAYKPGDILDTYAGKTVEVGNTDAEGRLVLCDLLAYSCERLAPTLLVDLATLTGACVVALGTQASGVFSRHDDLAESFLASARLAGEKMWRLPLYEEYLHPMQQGPADLRSTGGRWGGPFPLLT